MKHNHRPISLLFVLVSLLAACSPRQYQQARTPGQVISPGVNTPYSGQPSPAISDLITDTPTITKTSIPSPTFTAMSPTFTAAISATETKIPTVTPTPFPLQAVWLALPAQPISASNVQDIKLLNRLGIDGVSSIISPNNQYLALATGRRLAFFDFNTLREIKLSKDYPDLYEQVSNFAFSPNSKYFAANIWGIYDSPGAVYVWQADTGKIALTIPAENGNFMFKSMAFSPDSSMLALGGFFGDVVLYDLEKKDMIRRIDTYKVSVDALAFTPDGKVIVTASQENTIATWDILNRTQLFSGKGEKIDQDHFRGFSNLTFSPDGQYIVTGSHLGYVEVWRFDAGSYQLQREQGWSADAKPIEGVAISPDGTLLVTSSEKGIQFWNMTDGALIKTLKGVHGDISFSSDGTLLSCGSQFFAVK